mgnify:CR=1 FL=1
MTLAQAAEDTLQSNSNLVERGNHEDEGTGGRTTVQVLQGSYQLGFIGIAMLDRFGQGAQQLPQPTSPGRGTVVADARGRITKQHTADAVMLLVGRPADQCGTARGLD